MKKIKFLIASMLGAIALVFACVLGTRVNATTVTYTVVAYSTSGENSTTNITTATNRTKSTRVDSTDENNTDVVTFQVGTAITFAQDKGSATGLNTSSNTNTSNRFFKVTIPAGYYVSSLVVNGDRTNSNARSVKLSSDGSSTSIANTSTGNLERNNPTDFELISSGKRLNYTEASGVIWIYVSNSACLYTVTVKLQKDIASATAVTASFDEAGGSSVEDIVLDEPGKINLPAGSTKAGYIFAGWKTGNTTYDAGDEFNLNADTEFVAQWTKDPSAWFSVTYEVDGGTAIAGLTDQVTGTKITLPVASKTGYVFSYWTANSETTELYPNTEYTITSNVTLHAHYVDLIYPEQTETNYILNPDNLATSDEDVTSSRTSGIFKLLGTESAKLTIDVGANEKKLPKSDSTQLSLTARIKFNGTSTCNADTKARVIQIDAPKSGKIKFLALQSNDSKVAYAKLLDSNYQSVDSKKACISSNFYLQEINIASAGTYYLVADSNAINVHYLEYVENPPIANSATTTVDVESAGTEVRFITTVSGVELANIKSLELVLWKNSVSDANKNANNLQMTTVYTSIINATKTYDVGTNTYYGIVKISGTDKLKARSITKLCFNVIVTFQDNSTKSMDNNLEFTL